MRSVLATMIHFHFDKSNIRPAGNCDERGSARCRNAEGV